MFKIIKGIKKLIYIQYPCDAFYRLILQPLFKRRLEKVSDRSNWPKWTEGKRSGSLDLQRRRLGSLVTWKRDRSRSLREGVHSSQCTHMHLQHWLHLLNLNIIDGRGSTSYSSACRFVHNSVRLRFHKTRLTRLTDISKK